MMFASLSTSLPLGVARRDTLFLDNYRKEFKAVQYDVFPNGQELLMMKLENRSGGRPMIVMNWPELLKRRGGDGRR
jgi:hypothetical protein